MVERFLLDRVDTETARSAIGGKHDCVILPAANEAEPSLTLAQLAESRAEIALDAPVLEFMPPVGTSTVVLPAARASRTSIHVISSTQTVVAAGSGFGVSAQL